MAGIKKLRKVQLGRETTAGTEVDATDLWRGPGIIEDQLETVFPDEDVGYLSGIGRSYIPKTQGAITLDEAPATFEQILHVLEAGVKTVSSTQDGSGSGYIYEYAFPTTTANTIKTYTVESGDNQEEEQMLYAFVEAFNLSGAAGEAVMVTSDWIGRQVSTGSYTSTTAIPTVEEIMFQKGKLYIDSDTATMGGTQVTNTFLDFSLDVVTGWVPVYTGDGNLYFSFNKNIGPEVMLDVTFEHDATAVAEKAAWRAGNGRLIRVQFEGAAFTTAGDSFSYPTLRIDLAGYWESFDKLADQNGNDVVTGTFRAQYSSVASTFAQITVVVAQAAVA